MPPLPPQVMMWEFAKLVTENVDRSPVGRPRRRGPRVSHESSTVCRPCAAAISATASQSGAFPMRFGNNSARDLGLDSRDVDAVRVELAVDQYGRDSLADEWSDIG